MAGEDTVIGLDIGRYAAKAAWARHGRITRLVTLERDHGSIDTSEPTSDYLDLYLAELAESTPMPLALEEELHPTRMVIRAKSGAPAPR